MEGSRPSGRAGVRPGVLALVGILLCVEAVLFARHAGPVLRRLADLDSVWLVVALVANTGSMLAFATLQRVMLTAAGARLSIRQALLMAYAGNGVSLTLPGGSVAGTAYTYRRMRRWGAPAAVVAWGLTAAAVVSSIALTLLAAVGATLADQGESRGLVQAAGELVAALLIVLAGRRLYAHPTTVRHLLERLTALAARVLRRPARGVPESVHGAVDAFLAVHPVRRVWGIGAVAAAANWILDLACLAAAGQAAVTGHLGMGTLLLAYASGKAAATLPLLPAGLGTVDGALVGVLAARGVPPAQALAAVLVYRGITVALLAVLGWAAAFVLHVEDTAAERTSHRHLHPEAPATDRQPEPAVDRGDGAPVEEELPG